jgi:Flp pilus assembly protein CpaB
VRRRARAAGFAAAAAACAGLAAASAGGARDEVALGSLRDVVVATEALPARRVLDRERVEKALEQRRIPETFAAPDALSDPAQALGRRPAAPIPAGAYLVGSQLLAPRRPDAAGAGPDLDAGRRPVELTVSAAGPLAGEVRGRVDVVVTTERTTGTGGGRTYVAARRVELLDLAPADAGSAQSPDPLAGAGSAQWVATLALTRGQALRLIHAQSFAREVRLIAA